MKSLAESAQELASTIQAGDILIQVPFMKRHFFLSAYSVIFVGISLCPHIL